MQTKLQSTDTSELMPADINSLSENSDTNSQDSASDDMEMRDIEMELEFLDY